MNSTNLTEIFHRYHGKVLEVTGDEGDQYKVQLVDEESLGIEDMIKVLPKDKIK